MATDYLESLALVLEGVPSSVALSRVESVRYASLVVQSKDLSPVANNPNAPASGPPWEAGSLMKSLIAKRASRQNRAITAARWNQKMGGKGAKYGQAGKDNPTTNQSQSQQSASPWNASNPQWVASNPQWSGAGG